MWAAQGRWDGIAELWAVLAEASRDRNQRASKFTALDLLHQKCPWMAKGNRPRGTALSGAGFRAMKSVFVKKRE